MKNSGSLTKIRTAGGIALAIALVAGFTSIAAAQEKGATKLLQSKPGQAPASETAAMSCPKCKDTAVTITEKPTKTGAKANTYTALRHECPECSQKLAVAGHGKTKSTTVTHVCKASGSETASCCAMK